MRLGRPAAHAVRRFLSDPRRPGLIDALSVARGLGQPELLDPALALAHHANDDVRARASAVLGVLGGEKAVEALTAQLNDAAPQVRAAAARALGELGAWTTCSALLRLLGDTSWPVRRERARAAPHGGGRAADVAARPRCVQPLCRRHGAAGARPPRVRLPAGDGVSVATLANALAPILAGLDFAILLYFIAINWRTSPSSAVPPGSWCSTCWPCESGARAGRASWGRR